MVIRAKCIKKKTPGHGLMFPAEVWPLACCLVKCSPTVGCNRAHACQHEHSSNTQDHPGYNQRQKQDHLKSFPEEIESRLLRTPASFWQRSKQLRHSEYQAVKGVCLSRKGEVQVSYRLKVEAGGGPPEFSDTDGIDLACTASWQAVDRTVLNQ